ncbi:hypothetical protein V1498_09525 [Peribacillus sp. SCS-26]|uniref:hypothetical protein n=1 Tax=Paraperibacillus marinus TaxID=3115295 RepID=UPI003906ABAB
MFTTISPKESFIAFENEEDYIQKIRDWGLISSAAKTAKHEFLYKRGSSQYIVKIAGYESTGNHETAVVSFENEVLHCVHPSYLKEMQSGTFGRETAMNLPDNPDGLPVSKPSSSRKGTAAAGAEKEKKAEKIDLPEEKVHFEAEVKEFSTKYNHFNETEEEILILEKVRIAGENTVDIGEAWCGYSKTLKKLDLAEGSKLEFDAKIVDRKLNKEIRYKINNPSKLALI